MADEQCVMGLTVCPTDESVEGFVMFVRDLIVWCFYLGYVCCQPYTNCLPALRHQKAGS